MITLEILRALAGIAASTTIDQIVKDRANEIMLKIMESLDKMVDGMINVESQAIRKESAAMNGIIS